MVVNKAEPPNLTAEEEAEELKETPLRLLWKRGKKVYGVKKLVSATDDSFDPYRSLKKSRNNKSYSGVTDKETEKTGTAGGRSNQATSIDICDTGQTGNSIMGEERKSFVEKVNPQPRDTAGAHRHSRSH